jgi:Mn-dependent DtxR family transcriptional regulator
LDRDGLPRPEVARFTPKQGQYLAFIHYYTKINGRSPSEADMQRYFKVTAPSVHQMILALDRLGLISRTPGQSRSIEVRVPRAQLPDLV